jgi:hypothetical protein
MFRKRALERWQTKLENCEVTPQANYCVNTSQDFNPLRREGLIRVFHASQFLDLGMITDCWIFKDTAPHSYVHIIYILMPQKDLRTNLHLWSSSHSVYTNTVIVPATEHGYFVASWWRTALRNPPKVTMRQWEKEKAVLYPVEVQPP